MIELVELGWPSSVQGQDGPYEQILKSRLSSVFSRFGWISSAFLVRAFFEDGRSTVILAIAGHTASPEELLPDIEGAFKSVFNAREWMDISFINDATAARLHEVCSPFYEAHRRSPDGA